MAALVPARKKTTCLPLLLDEVGAIRELGGSSMD